MTFTLQEPISAPIRLRRNRKSEAIRSMVQETKIQASNLVIPYFLVEGQNLRIPIPSMPGVERLSIDQMLADAQRYADKGVKCVCLFPVIDAALKNESADEAWNPNNLTARAIRALKKAIPHLCVMCDVALDPYTSHGHDGLVDDQGNILNDATIECLVCMSLVQADAGVDYVAPSDMMDGRVRAIRKELDKAHFEQVGILSYSAKYASALYGPFRDALGVNLTFGDKKTYQMDPSNRREALLEAFYDEEEGADILMVKPALLYLDVITKLREQTNRPIAAYHVSGEYAMVMAAHERGWLDAGKVFYESLLSIKRAGADLIFTYSAPFVLDHM